MNHASTGEVTLAAEKRVAEWASHVVNRCSRLVFHAMQRTSAMECRGTLDLAIQCNASDTRSSVKRLDSSTLWVHA